MKTIPVSLIVAGLLIPVVSSAQTAGTAQGPAPGAGVDNPGPPRPFLEGWIAADANHDGFISTEEFGAMPRIQQLPDDKRQHLFERLDKDGDGKISREELGRMGKSHDGQTPPLQRLWELDVDKSGGINFEEFKAGQLFKKLPPDRQEQLFRRLDTNRDGLITPADKPDPPFKRDGGKADGGRFEPRQIIRQLDRNHDGMVSLDEFRAGPPFKDLTADEQQARFNALDRNHDGQLSPDDFPPPAPRGEGKRPEGPPAAPDPK